MYIIYLTRNSSIFIDLGFFGHFRGSQHEGDEKEEDVESFSLPCCGHMISQAEVPPLVALRHFLRHALLLALLTKFSGRLTSAQSIT